MTPTESLLWFFIHFWLCFTLFFFFLLNHQLKCLKLNVYPAFSLPTLALVARFNHHQLGLPK